MVEFSQFTFCDILGTFFLIPRTYGKTVTQSTKFTPVVRLSSYKLTIGTKDMDSM